MPLFYADSFKAQNIQPYFSSKVIFAKIKPGCTFCCTWTFSKNHYIQPKIVIIV